MLLGTGHQDVGRAVEHAQHIVREGGKQQVIGTAQPIGATPHPDDRHGARQTAQAAGRVHPTGDGEIDQGDVELATGAGIGQFVAVRVVLLTLEDQFDQPQETLAEPERSHPEYRTGRFGSNGRRGAGGSLAT